MKQTKLSPENVSPDGIHQLQVIDSHTGGEPTRLVVAGGPDLGGGSVAQQLEILRTQHDWLRSAVVNEPRGSDVMVGALLCRPSDPTCAAGVIYFNNVGYLGMCGHGTIGLMVTLGHMQRIALGEHRIETSVGVITARLEDRNTVSLENVESYRLAKSVEVDVPGLGIVRGDVAWAGNWFFLVAKHGLELSLDNVSRLTDYTLRVRAALEAAGITGKNAQTIDHVELYGPPLEAGNDSRSFVLCPGGAYDRSPCGTGTSAKLACLVADGTLAPGQVWRQESVIGSVFEGSVRIDDSHRIYPRIRGRAFVNAETTIILDPADPFRVGIRA